MDRPSADVAHSTSFAALGVASDLVAVLDGLGFVEPFPVQTLTISDALAGRDVCGEAQTGSGKTLAFGIPLIERCGPAATDGPQAVILVPTRELCRQVTGDLEPLAAARGLRIVSVYGGVPMRRQIDRVHGGVDIVVATPGRLIDLAERRHLDLRNVSAVVLDEADQMADMGFLPQVHRVMSFIGGEHQTMLFSATLDGQIRSLVTRYLTDPVRHGVEQDSEVAEEQEHRFLAVHYMDKVKVVGAIAESSQRTLVFVATKRNADRLARDLADEGTRARAIHGDLRQQIRERTLGDFARGRLPVLVATNVAARGLHISDVDVVIHYDPPSDYKSFIHRSGRTARAGESGLVVTLVEWDQVEEVQRLQRASGLHYEITKMYSNDPRLRDLLAFEPERVELKMKSAVDLSRRAGGRRRRR